MFQCNFGLNNQASFAVKYNTTVQVLRFLRNSFDSILFFSKSKIKRKVTRFPGVFNSAKPYLLRKIYMPQAEKYLGTTQVCTYHRKALK